MFYILYNNCYFSRPFTNIGVHNKNQSHVFVFPPRITITEAHRWLVELITGPTVTICNIRHSSWSSFSRCCSACSRTRRWQNTSSLIILCVLYWGLFGDSADLSIVYIAYWAVASYIYFPTFITLCTRLPRALAKVTIWVTTGEIIRCVAYLCKTRFISCTLLLPSFVKRFCNLKSYLKKNSEFIDWFSI